MREVFICDAARTPIGRYGGALAKVRTDDLAAVPIKALVARNAKADWSRLDEVVFGCANQAGEDNRNVARMALLLAGLPDAIPGVTVNRLCASGLDAVGDARARSLRRDGFRHRRRRRIDDARAVRHGQSRRSVFARGAMYDTTLGWRFINPLLKAQYGVDPWPKPARTSQRSSRSPVQTRMLSRYLATRAAKAQAAGFAEEIVAGRRAGRQGDTSVVDEDEHPRPETTLENLQTLKPLLRNPGTVTAGNASGINDGAAAIIHATEEAAKAHGLRRAPVCSAWPRPRCRRASWASARCRRPESCWSASA